MNFCMPVSRLTCGRVAAGSVPGWCCRRWRPAWGWCCTHPLPPLPGCLAGRGAEPETAASSLPWSPTGWKPLGTLGMLEKERLREVSGGESLAACRCFSTLGWRVPAWGEALWQTQTLDELAVAANWGANITSSVFCFLFSAPEGKTEQGR